MTRVVIVFSGEGVESTVAALRTGAAAEGAGIRLRRLPGGGGALDEVLEAIVWADGVALVGDVRSDQDDPAGQPIRRLLDAGAARRERLLLDRTVVVVRTVGARPTPELLRGVFSWDCLLLASPSLWPSADASGRAAGDAVADEVLGRRLARLAGALRSAAHPTLRRAG
ncbi:hypothetical protein [Saccharomonospora sp. NB11]|uniref:hypothetical protein n=1 Tax=Saccharomonospora sp. NB11 TaxID=1642298 RepID=UPI0018D075AB|nr:hypothetical protein [Saccharomonospora sp. NB11]